MSDVKISELPTAATVLSSTILPTVTSGTTEQATVSQLANGLFGSVSPGTYGSSTYAPVLTVDSKGRITAINQTAIAGGGGGSSITGVFNVRNYGAVGDGSTNDYVAINTALVACCSFNGGNGGTLYFPSGTYYIGTALSLANRTGNITLLGDGPKTSIIKTAAGVVAVSFEFDQSGAGQPYAPTIANLGFQCAGAGPVDLPAIRILYNVPGGVTNYHNASGPTITNCEIRSISNTQYWDRGIEITSAWNTRITDTYVSGYSDGNWNNLKGVGLFFHKSCVNSSVLNCQFNFFIRGIKLDNATVPTQGLTVTDCIFVGVRSAGYFDSAVVSPPGFPYATSSIIWTGGIVDMRIAGTSPASPVPGFYAANTNEITISNVQFVTDTQAVASCGVLLDGCSNASVLNSMFYAFAGAGAITATGTGTSIQVLGNRFYEVPLQVYFGPNVSRSVYRDSVLRGTYADDYTNVGTTTNNILEGSIAGAATTVYLNSAQTIASGSETAISWTTALTPSQFGIWSISDPTKLFIPAGAKKVRLTANVRWDTGTVGAYKEIKIKDDNFSEVWASSSVATYYGDQSITTPIIPVAANMHYFTLTAFQSSGFSTSVRGVKGTNFTLEVIA